MMITERIATAVRASIKLKLILFIVTLLGLSIGIAPWSAIKLQEHQLLRTSQERLRSLHEMLRKTVIATCMLAGDPESVQDVIEAVSHHESIYAVRIFTTEGVIRYSSQPTERGVQLSPRELSRFYGHADPVILTNGGEPVIHTLVQPMFNQPECLKCHVSGGKVIGILQVSLSLDRTWRQLADLKRSAVLATLITLGVIVIGIWLSLTHLIDRPLQQLVTVMGQAKQGDLSARVKLRNSDELGQLARHFNDMISKLHAAHGELERYHQEQLARADRLATIGELAAAIAHEIRNPLTGISGALSVLSRDFPSDDSRREIVGQIHLLIDRLNTSVESILHYSRPSQPHFRVTNVEDIVDQTLFLVEGEARKAQVHVIKQATPQSRTGEPTIVNADPHQIQQVLMNLVLNAIQATQERGRVWIRTSVSQNESGQKHVRIAVEDSGKGMSPDAASKAFQPFFSSKAQGTGLGLPIAKQIVEQHQGRISLRSTPGNGTRVEVELPAA